MKYNLAFCRVLTLYALLTAPDDPNVFPLTLIVYFLATSVATPVPILSLSHAFHCHVKAICVQDLTSRM